MIMLDYPSSLSGCDGVSGQWRALRELYANGLTRSIAVSNFSPAQLQCLVAPAGAGVSAPAPAVNQMRYCVGGHGSEVETDAKYGTIVQAYSPLGSGRLPSDPLLQQIAASHGKSAAQVALRWILQHNATIATQSTSSEHLKADLELFDFELTAAEMKQLDEH